MIESITFAVLNIKHKENMEKAIRVRLGLSSSELSRSFDLMSLFCGRCKSMAILDDIKFEFSNGVLRVYGSDVDNYAGRRLDLLSLDGNEDCSDFSFCVDFGNLSRYVRSISDEVLYLSYDSSLNELEVSHIKGSVKLPCDDADDFPIVTYDSENVDRLSLPSSELALMLSNGMRFSATDKIHEMMQGIHFFVGSDYLECCSTDGKLLYVDRKEIDEVNDAVSSSYFKEVREDKEKVEFVLLNGIHRALLDICKNAKERMMVELYDKKIVFKSNGSLLVAAFPVGKYPNYRSVIPSDSPICVSLDRLSMLDSVQRLRGLSKSNVGLIKLCFSNNSLKICLQEVDYNITGEETISCDCSSDLSIGFDINKLLNVLGTLTTDTVIVKMIDSGRPSLWLEKDGRPNKIELLMPLMIN